jgi:SAM-dependent methyltransferase
VGDSTYADAFGLQWNRFRTTQHDSSTATTISRDRLERCLGGLERVRGRAVLEVGCGSGRFTEVLLTAGARVLAVDLTRAIDVNYANNSGSDHYGACQADIRHLPVAPESVDVVVALGVVQHTPDPERTIQALGEALVPDGLLVFDHYSTEYPVTPSRRVARALFLRLPAHVASRAALGLSRVLLPLHKLTWRDSSTSRRIRHRLVRISPLVDYYDAYRQLGTKTLEAWSILDTHDTLTDRYKHLRSAEELRSAVESAGLILESMSAGGNGIEVRALKPAA